MKRYIYILFSLLTLSLYADNQTATVSPIQPETNLPFRLRIQLSDFSLPTGIHSGSYGVHKDKWLFIGGRTNGLHGFDPVNNFPPENQNTTVYVVDIKHKKVYAKSLFDPTANLTQAQIDTLSVTSPQFYQTGKTLYITGGYGIDTASNQFTTKDVLTAIDIHGLIEWVMKPKKDDTAAQHIRQTTHPIVQVTGGYMDQNFKGDTLLIFGQNFAGPYEDSSNGIYTNQVRRFRIHDDGRKLSVHVKGSSTPNPSFRRRDLPVCAVMQDVLGFPLENFIAFSGVFTESGGVWTVPVEVSSKGVPFMADPNAGSTFKQGMNNYVCPTISMYSEHRKTQYVAFIGGISFGYFQNGVFTTDPEDPFINQVTTISRDKNGQYNQYLMSAEYPTLISTGPNPGNTLLFGAGAEFIPVRHVADYRNGVLKFDKIKKSRLIGYVVGGIQSTLPNTNTKADSTASPYIFEVYFDPA